MARIFRRKAGPERDGDRLLSLPLRSGAGFDPSELVRARTVYTGCAYRLRLGGDLARPGAMVALVLDGVEYVPDDPAAAARGGWFYPVPRSGRAVPGKLRLFRFDYGYARLEVRVTGPEGEKIWFTPPLAVRVDDGRQRAQIHRMAEAVLAGHRRYLGRVSARLTPGGERRPAASSTSSTWSPARSGSTTACWPRCGPIPTPRPGRNTTGATSGS